MSNNELNIKISQTKLLVVSKVDFGPVNCLPTNNEIMKISLCATGKTTHKILTKKLKPGYKWQEMH